VYVSVYDMRNALACTSVGYSCTADDTVQRDEAHSAAVIRNYLCDLFCRAYTKRSPQPRRFLRSSHQKR
jgi:hypothetical protein